MSGLVYIKNGSKNKQYTYKIKMKNIMVNKKVQRKKKKYIFLFALKHERTGWL